MLETIYSNNQTIKQYYTAIHVKSPEGQGYVKTVCVSSVRQDLQIIGRGERSVTPVLDGQHHATPQGLQKISMFSSATPAGLGILGSF